MQTKSKAQKRITKVRLERPIIKQRNHITPGSTSLLPHVYKAPKRQGFGTMKVYDLALQTLAPTTTAIITPLFAPAQGVALNNRVGDVVYLDQMDMNYTCDAANSDIYSNLRVMCIQWHNNSSLVAPTLATILQTVSDGIYGVLDYGYSDQFTVFWDERHSFSGTATNPTASSNQGAKMVFPAGTFKRKVIFNTGTTAGSNLPYMISFSDSAAAPSPNLIFKSRITYQEER